MVRQSSISCLMSDVRCPMSDVRCPMSDVILYRRFLGVAVVFSEPKATSATLPYTIPDIGHRTSDIRKNLRARTALDFGKDRKQFLYTYETS